MALDDLQKRRVEKVLGKFCAERIPDRVKDQIEMEYGIRGNYVTLFEKRRHYQDEEKWIKMKVAQFRYNDDSNKWSLYWWRYTGRWHQYKEIEPSNNLQELVDEVDKDPIAVFWG